MINATAAQAFPVPLPPPTNIAPLVSAGGQQPGTATPNANGTIPQTERLFTMRSRGAFQNQELGGDRGTRAYIRLLTSNPAASSQRHGRGEGIETPPILTGAGNPLDQAINGGKYGGYADFLLTQVRCSLDEKLQIVETFGDGEVVYYFGRQPIVFTMAGILIDSVDNEWFVKWMTMYGQVMRGTQLAQNYELLQIVLPNMDVIGTIPHMSWSQDSSNDTLISFEFQFLAKQIIPKPVVVPGAPLSNAASLIDFSSADSFLSQQGINSIKAQAAAVLDVVKNPASTISDIAGSMANLGGGLSGGTGASQSSNPTSSAISRGIDAASSAIRTVSSNVSDVFNSVSANLAGIRAALFSPIYGVLSSLTKLIQNVRGAVSEVFNALTSPVADIIRDVVNVTNQAIGIVNMVNAAARNPWSLLDLGIGSLGEPNLRIILGSLLNSKGSIPTQPMSLEMSLRGLMKLGVISPNTRWLQDLGIPTLSRSVGRSVPKAALLGSGPTPTPESGAFL